MNPNRTSKKQDETNSPPSSPYGPHPRGVDEAAGGADSSPHETEPTGERKQKADEQRHTGRNADSTGETNQNP